MYKTRSAEYDSNFLIRSGSYEIAKADNVQTGTKIVLHLRTECREYSDDSKVTGEFKINEK